MKPDAPFDFVPVEIDGEVIRTMYLDTPIVVYDTGTHIRGYINKHGDIHGYAYPAGEASGAERDVLADKIISSLLKL